MEDKETVCSSLIDVDRRFPTVFRRKGLHASKVELREKWDGLCYHDAHPFDSVPWPEVAAFHCDGPEMFEVSWRIAFCSPGCELAWLLEQNDHNARARILALKCFAIKVMGVRTEYAAAAPKTALRRFSPEHGIFDRIEDFRAANRVAVHVERDFPLVPHSIVWEERIVRREHGGDALPGEAPGSCFRSKDFVQPSATPFPIRGRKLPVEPQPPKAPSFRAAPGPGEPLFQRFVADASAGEAGNGAVASVLQDAVRSELQSQKKRKPSGSAGSKKRKKDEQPAAAGQT